MTEQWGTILVVDDDADMRELAHDILKDRGHQVATAGSGEEALKRLAEGDYAVVLTDLRMKGMQGTELLAQMTHLPACHTALSECMNMTVMGFAEAGG